MNAMMNYCTFCGAPMGDPIHPLNATMGTYHGRKWTQICTQCGATFEWFETGGSVVWQGWDEPGSYPVDRDDDNTEQEGN